MRNFVWVAIFAAALALFSGGYAGAQGADECINAQAITITGPGTYVVFMDSTTATDSNPPLPLPANCPGTFLDVVGADIWFSFVPDQDMTFEINTCDGLTPGWDTDLVLYEGPADCSLLTEITCNGDDASLPNCQPFSSRIVGQPLIAGTNYLIRCGGWQGDTGIGDLTITAVIPSAEICDDGLDNDVDGLVDCFDPDCAGDPVCFEGDDITCSDGIDNDADGLIDCVDPDCGGTSPCGIEICGNGIDDDLDNLIDCFDPDCFGDPTCFEGDDASCSDGLDNDADGLTDCFDPDCGGTAVCGTEICGDGVDNDGDGFIDCFDVDCAPDPICFEGDAASCGDGIDNDADGLTDCSDPDCGPFPPCGPEICDDDFDNDGDGLTDCCDTDDCPAGSPACQPAANDDCIVAEVIPINGPGTYTVFMDSCTATDSTFPGPSVPCNVAGAFSNDIWFSLTPDQDMTWEIHTCDDTSWDTDLLIYEGSDCTLLTEIACDGDGSGLTGCQAFYSRVLGVQLTAGVEYKVRVGSWASGASGNGILTLNAVIPAAEVCDDGLDNDVDGLVDCFDPDCAADPLCFEGDEASCSDGIDNDVDGLTDCADPDCGGTAVCGTEICDNGVDDDGDTAIDCADTDCAGDPVCCAVPGDECCTALPLVAGANLLDTTTFTNSPQAVNCITGSPGFGGINLDGWYTYTAAFDGIIEWDTCDPAGFDTDVLVYEGDCSNLVEIDCSGDGAGLVGCQVFYSASSFQATAGETYIFRLGGFGATTGGLVTLNINDFCGSAITGLTGSSDCAADEVFLTWVDAGYDTYDVSRNGVVIATGLPTGTVSYSDTGLANGTYEYTVTGVCVGGAAGFSSTTQVIVSCASGGETDLIISTEGGAGLINSTAALEAALTANGVSFLTTPDYPSSQLGNVIGVYERVWVMTGTYPEDGRMTAADVDALGTWVEAGIGVFFEGGDHWGFATVAGLFDSYDGVTSAADGDDSFTAMDGLDTLLGVDWSDLIGVPYNQDQAGNDWSDQLTIGPEGGGPNVGAIWQQAGGGYVTGALSQNQDINGDPIGTVLVQSWEFGGFGGDQTDLAARMLATFGGGGPALPEYNGGDCNADGGFNIADAIFLLAALFSGGPAGECLDACDANGDGGINIADAIFALAALFSGGPAPLPDSCGPDPDDTDPLDCASFPPCP